MSSTAPPPTGSASRSRPTSSACCRPPRPTTSTVAPDPHLTRHDLGTLSDHRPPPHRDPGLPPLHHSRVLPPPAPAPPPPGARAAPPAHRLSFADFGVARPEGFELTAAYTRFLRRHAGYDRRHTTGPLTTWLAAALTPGARRLLLDNARTTTTVHD